MQTRLKYLILVFLFISAYFVGDQKLINLLVKNYDEIIKQEVKSDVVKNDYKDLGNNFIGKSTVTYIVDGDTVHAEDEAGNKQILRFLAVNTLEKNSTNLREKCLSKLQTEFTKNNLLEKQVFLYSDPTQPKRDKYDRMLVYVSTTSTSTYSFNEFLVDTGNAKVYKASPKATKYDLYLEKQNIAIRERLGMWNEELCK